MLIVSASDPARLLTVSERGYGKRTALEEYRVQGRGGKGVRAMRLGARNGGLCGAVAVSDEDRVMLVTSGGTVIKMRAGDIRETVNRGSQGVRLIRLKDGEGVVAVCRVAEAEEDDE
ncbi:MAG: DNA gyrase C-terminal beta-propeller domain-containing protein, partial [bacterium]